ncbi:sorting nexin-29-like [Anopheles aquasalis]|uniref:sorting nexin-29-like n=1 Tax=Anopheles aquasalis TaxID=42839 RepID=UPI00215B1AB8|nr:sorting nexin-29-like [Anopheles aquasalis]
MVGMSTFSSLTLESVIGISLGMTSSGYEAEQVRKVLIGELLVAVRDCQRHYGGKTELATEHDPRIRLLCEAWEGLLAYGLKQGSVSGMLQNVVGELVALSSGSGAGPATDGPVFWDFAYRHLTNHERERFSTLRHVWSACGKGRALLRAILNERALERYVLMWLSDEQLLAEYYEPWALLRNAEVQHLLPNVAAGLGTILFAIAFDVPELNSAHSGDGGGGEERREPIIATRRPAGPVRKINAIERVIMESASLSTQEKGPSGIPRIATATTAPAVVEAVSGGSGCSTTTDDSCSSLTASTVISGPAIDATRNTRTADEPLIKTSPDQSNCATLQTSEAPVFSVDHALVAIEQTTNRATSCDRITEGIPALVPNHASSGLAVEDASEADDPLAVNQLAMTLAATVPYRVCDSDSFERLRQHTSELEERCHLLESRVAELSLENHRLRMVTSANRNSMAYFSFAIPKAIQRTSAGRSRRPFHVYEIRISPAGGVATAEVGQGILLESSSSSWSLYRRYNEFYRLHKRLQRDYPSAKTLDFPPKKKLGNMNVDFVEQRRQRLQVYLNSLFAVVLPEVLSCRTRAQLEQVFPFFCDDRL